MNEKRTEEKKRRRGGGEEEWRMEGRGRAERADERRGEERRVNVQADHGK